MDNIKELLKIVSNNFKRLECKADAINEIAQIWIDALKFGNKIIFCGNGGSATDAQHLASELLGRYKYDREPLSALALTLNTSTLTAISNDYGYDYVFSRQLKGIGKNGDVLVGISTSGNSQNIIEAVNVAKNMGIKTVAFTGASGGELIKIADLTLNVPSEITNNIQEMHIASGHIICGIVEEFFYNNSRNS